MGVLVLLTSVGVLWLGVQDDQQSDCNARYNEQQAASQRVRAEAAQADRDALEKLVRSLVDDNPGDNRERLEEYLASLAETDRERQENPVPPPPADLCN